MTVAEPSPVPEAPSWTRARIARLVVLLGSLTALGPLTIDSYLPALPQMQTELGASESQVQATITGVLLGMGLGQLVIGPLSDQLGRRRPLLVGLIGHVVVSVAIALVDSITVLTGLRLLQGLAGAAIAVVVMAIIRDLFSGLRAVTLLSRMALVMGLGPILAPNIGGLLLAFGSWHLIFWFLAAAGAVLWFVALRFVPETLPPQRRLAGGGRAALGAYRRVLADRNFLAMLIVAAAGSTALFSYIAGATFILQAQFGLSPQQFALVFALNGVIMVAMSQLNPTLGRLLGIRRTLTGSVLISLIAAAAMIVAARAEAGGLAGFLVPVFVVIPMLGFNMANTTALALEHHPRSAGTANALLGAARFAVSGVLAPLVGLFADGTAAPLGWVLFAVNAVALATLLLTGRLSRRDASPPDSGTRSAR